MKRKEIIATLLEVSNDLDSMGMFADADVLTKTAQSFGDLNPFDPDSNPDNSGSEFGFLGEEGYNRELEAMEEMRREDALMDKESRIEALKNKQMPTEADLAELDAMLMDKMGVQKPDNESDFAQLLADSGADVNLGNNF